MEHENETSVDDDASFDLSAIADEAPVKQESDQDRNWRQMRELVEGQKQQISELTAMLRQQNQPVQPPEEELSPYDLATVEKVEKIADKRTRKLMSEALAERDRQAAEQIFLAKNPDYEETIKTYLPELVKENPEFAEAIKAHPRPYECAYKLVKASWKYKASTAKKSPLAKKTEDNLSQPASGNASKGSSLKSAINNFQGMSPADIYALSQKYASGR